MAGKIGKKGCFPYVGVYRLIQLTFFDDVAFPLMSALSNTSGRESRRSGGNLRERNLNVSSITFALISQDDSVVHEWCRPNGLLLTGVPCPVDDCSRYLDLRSLSRGHGGVVFRCSRNRKHTRRATYFLKIFCSS